MRSGPGRVTAPKPAQVWLRKTIWFVAKLVLPESLKGSAAMTVGAAQVSPPAAIAEGLTGALAPVAIKMIDRRTSDRTLDRIVMIPTPGNGVLAARAPPAKATV